MTYKKSIFDNSSITRKSSLNQHFGANPRIRVSITVKPLSSYNQLNYFDYIIYKILTLDVKRNHSFN